MIWLILALTCAWLTALLALALGWQLLRQNGRILIRLDCLEEQLAQGGEAGTSRNGRRHPYGRALADSKINRSGLKAGTPAPGFTLPRLDGGELSLQEYRGRRILLVFSDPQCGPCDALMPELERLHRRWRGERGEAVASSQQSAVGSRQSTLSASPSTLPQVLMVSRGDPEANRAGVRQHRVTFAVVLQRQWEISRLYGMFATPIAYLVDPEGVIEADVAVGLEAIVTLAESSGSGAQSPRDEMSNNGRLTKSGITRARG